MHRSPESERRPSTDTAMPNFIPVLGITLQCADKNHLRYMHIV